MESFLYLPGGPYVYHELTATKTYRIKSISEDVVFAVTCNRHLQIGMTIKSLAVVKKLLIC